MRVGIFALILIVVTETVSSQETTVATSEPLATLPIGSGLNHIQFELSEEGFYSPNSPLVSSEEELVFLPKPDRTSVLIFDKYKKNLRRIPFVANTERDEIVSDVIISQQGYGVLPTLDILLVSRETLFFVDRSRRNNVQFNNSFHNYPAPFGAILYSDKERSGLAIVFDVKNPKPDFSVISQSQLERWLPNQPGGFRIGDDGLLYRNGVLWSAIKPAGMGGIYLGRLASGHVIWGSGGKFHLINAEQEIELEVSAPWGSRNSPNGGFYNYGIGPWGEVYYLIPPPYIPTGGMRAIGGGDIVKEYKFDETKPAELVVVRNHLKYFGRLNADGVRLRQEPSTTADILATYPAKTGFRILGQGGNTETINGKTSDWTQVRMLDGKEGWVFGAFVHNLYDGPNGSPPPWPNVPDW